MPVSVPPPRERWLTREEVQAWIDGAHARGIDLRPEHFFPAAAPVAAPAAPGTEDAA
jgi:hypothetical protein